VVFWQLLCIYSKCAPRKRVSKSRHGEEREEQGFNLLNAHKGSLLLTDSTITDKTTMRMAVLSVEVSDLSLLAILDVVQKHFLSATGRASAATSRVVRCRSRASRKKSTRTVYIDISQS
jgi:ribosomal protein S26